MNRYAHVSPHTRTWLAEQRDTLDSEEMFQAMVADSLEQETDKAWRGVLQAQQMVRFQLNKMRRALYDMGRPLSPRARAIILADLKAGHRWHDPRPESTLIQATKHLLGNMALLKQRWAALREAENNQRRTTC